MGWSTVNNVPASIDTMLLLTDGSVMAHVLASRNWYRLIPDKSGAYANGTWVQTAPMLNDSNLTATMNGPTYAPVFFGSAVLQDGTVLVFGGEYNVQYSSTSPSVDALEVQLYDPTTDSWAILPNPPGWTNIGDPASAVLADGRVLFGNPNNAAMALFDPQTQTYFFTSVKNDNSSEETFTLLPTGDVLTVQCSNGTNAELYTPSTDTWLQMGSTGVSLPQPCSGAVSEIGPAILLPNGNVFAIGASGNTAVYTPGAAGTAGTWSNGPTLVDTSNNTTFPMDAPAVLLTNGQVLLTASPSPACSYPGPTTFYLYNSSTNKATITPGPTNNGSPCFTGRFLLLPSGDVLFSNQSGTVSILAPVGGARRPGPLRSPTARVRSFWGTLTKYSAPSLTDYRRHAATATTPKWPRTTRSCVSRIQAETSITCAPRTTPRWRLPPARRRSAHSFRFPQTFPQASTTCSSSQTASRPQLSPSALARRISLSAWRCPISRLAR